MKSVVRQSITLPRKQFHIDYAIHGKRQQQGSKQSDDRGWEWGRATNYRRPSLPPSVSKGMRRLREGETRKRGPSQRKN